MAEKKSEQVVFPPYHGETFLTGGLIGIALIVATVFAVFSIENAWAPKPPKTEYVERYIADSSYYDLISHAQYKADQEELGACRKDNNDWTKKWDKIHLSGNYMYFTSSSTTLN